MSFYASLIWKDGAPYSETFGDVYFSSDDGLAETRYVFIEKNRLVERWQNLQTKHFTIIETGFGTGLNFLCAWQTWLAHAPENAILHFVSIEKYPLHPNDLAQALARWPQLKLQADALLSQYQPIAHGWHRYRFAQGRVCLTLVIADVDTALPELDAKADAWFLDGFAPSRNPQMWQPALFEHMVRLSAPDVTFATFTSASIVRQGLQQAGFHVEKTPGFGKKREMLCGQLEKSSDTPKEIPQHAIVIGGGLAGTATAHALAGRGINITLIERHHALAQEASGNPVGVVYPRISHLEHIPSRFSIFSYLYTIHWLKQLGLPTDHAQACGVLQLGFNERELARCQKVAGLGLPETLVQWLDASAASAVAGVRLEYPGLFFPQTGWVKPRALCEHLVQHSNIQLQLATTALQLKRAGNFWQVWDEKQCVAEASTVILTNAADLNAFAQTAHVPLLKVRGQISVLNSAHGVEPQTVICSDGYLTPAVNQQHCLGATFAPGDAESQCRESDHLTNLNMLKHMSEDLYDAFAQQPMRGRVASRCTTNDYLPVVGQIMDTANATFLQYHEGLYVNAAYGAKGLIYAPYSAEMLASQITHQPMPLANTLFSKLNPNRFWLRKLGLRKL